MQPFALPDFYMPYPARLNLSLKEAREHSKAWAYQMGILDTQPDPGDAVIWDETKFDSMDYALLCAYTHPDAPSRELDLVTDWVSRSSRYMNETSNRPPTAAERLLSGPTGLGTSAVQITPSPGALGLQRFKSYTHVPYEAVGPVTLPEFYMPYSARVNSNLERSRQHCIDWARKMGMLDSLPGIPGLGIWDEENLALFDFAVCAARIHPDASGPELDLSSAWLTWGTYGDDYLPAVFGTARDMAGAKVFNARLSEFMPLDCATTPPPTNPAETGLADLWIRTAWPMTIDQRRQFRWSVEVMTESWLWELANHIQQRVPDPVDYVEMRRKTFGSDLTMSLARITRAGQLPPEIFHTRPMRGLENSAQDYACFTNDIFSYQKEIEFEGELHNCVLVVQKFLDIDREQAVLVVNDLMTSRLQQFEHIIAAELPHLAEDYNLDTAARAALNAYVVGLQDWVAGILDWHMLTGRYKEATLKRNQQQRAGRTAFLRDKLRGYSYQNTAEIAHPAPTRLFVGPTELSTSAVRIGLRCDRGRVAVG